jgi:hypothetical protein
VFLVSLFGVGGSPRPLAIVLSPSIGVDMMRRRPNAAHWSAPSHSGFELRIVFVRVPLFDSPSWCCGQGGRFARRKAKLGCPAVQLCC